MTQKRRGRGQRLLVLIAGSVAGAGGLTMLAVPAASASSVAPCVSFTGAVSSDWSTAGNWSSNAVPSSTDDVCIPDNNAVTVTDAANANSLLLGQASLTVTDPGTLTVVHAATLNGQVNLENATFSAGSIEVNNDINAQGSGTSTVSSPALHNATFGTIDSNFGTLALTTDPTNLSGGTLTGGSWEASNGGSIQFQSDITTLKADVSAGSSAPINFQDSSGHDALATLRTIAPGGTLALQGNLGGSGPTAAVTTTGPLAARGTLTFIGLDANLTVGGNVTVSGTLDARGDSLHAPTVTITSSGIATGMTTIDGNLVNGGKLTTGANEFYIAPGSPLPVTGNYTQKPGGSLTIGSSNGQLSVLNVGGTAQLAGAFNFTVPGPTNSADTVITATSRTGTFSSKTFGTSLRYLTNRVVAVAGPAIEGNSPVRHGQVESVQGVHFPPGETVSLYLDRVSGTPLRKVAVASNGVFVTSFKIPASTARHVHQLIAVSRPSGTKASAPIKVS